MPDMTAGDNSTQIANEGGGTFNIGTNLTATEVLEIGKGAARTVLMESWPFAEKLIDQRIEYILDRLIRKMQAKDEGLLNNFRNPRFLAALVSIEKSFAETGDIELGEILTGLLTDLASKETRSRREIVLRQAVECAPRLTTKHLNALSVILRVDQIRYPFAFTPSALASIVAGHLSPYFDAVPEDKFDYEYMGSTEAGTYLPMSTSNYLDRIYYAHHNALYEPFDITEFMQAFDTRKTSVEEIQSRMSDVMPLLKAIPDDPKRRVKLEYSVGQRILTNNDQIIKTLKPGENNLRAFLKNRSVSTEQFSEIVREQQPALARFFDKLEKSHAFDFRLSPVGHMLARHEIESRSPEAAKLLDRVFEG